MYYRCNTFQNSTKKLGSEEQFIYLEWDKLYVSPININLRLVLIVITWKLSHERYPDLNSKIQPSFTIESYDVYDIYISNPDWIAKMSLWIQSRISHFRRVSGNYYRYRRNKSWDHLKKNKNRKRKTISFIFPSRCPQGANYVCIRRTWRCRESEKGVTRKRLDKHLEREHLSIYSWELRSGRLQSLSHYCIRLRLRSVKQKCRLRENPALPTTTTTTATTTTTMMTTTMTTTTTTMTTTTTTSTHVVMEQTRSREFTRCT